MKTFESSSAEKARLTELRRYQVLDTPSEQTYDDIVRLAAQICESPIALLSFVDDRRQWFKAKHGLDIRETSREHSLCAYAVHAASTLVVPNALNDERFKSSPFVTGEPGIQFYAGVPLVTPSGAALGTLCVIDKVGRTLRPTQVAMLEMLARQVMSHLNLQLKTTELENVIIERDQRTLVLAEREERLGLMLSASQAAIWDWDIPNKTLLYSSDWMQLFGVGLDEMTDNVLEWRERVHPDDVVSMDAWVNEGLLHPNKPFHREYRMRHKRGHYMWVSMHAVALHDENGVPYRAVGTILDISQRKHAENEVRESRLQLQRVLDRVTALTGVLATDGTVSHMNETAVISASLVSEDVIGKPIAETYWFAHSPHSQEQVQSALRQAQAGKDARFDCAVQVGPGNFGTYDLSIRPVFDTDHNVEILVVSAIDITGRKEAEEVLFQAKERAEITLRSIGDAVITSDQHGAINSLNPAAEQLLGITGEAAIGRPVAAIFRVIHERTRRPLENPVTLCLQSASVVERPNDTVLHRSDGTEISIAESAGPIKTSNGDLVGAVLIFRDVSEERRLIERVSYQASHDSLTTLPNRQAFERQLKLMATAALEQDIEHVLCFIDLDQFKVVNDTCGHAAGDALLTQISAMMRAKIRQHDTLARLGGDEFGLILDRCAIDRAVVIATELKDSIQSFRFSWADRVFIIGASIGIAPITKTSGTIAALMSAADSACYAAKASGRNRVKVYAGNGRVIDAGQGGIG